MALTNSLDVLFIAMLVCRYFDEFPLLKFTFYIAPATNKIKRIRQKSYNSGELFNKHFCKYKILLSPI